MTDATSRRERRRATLSIARFKLGEEPSDDLSTTTTVAQRLAMMWPLARRAWRLTGRPFPTYSRANIPARVLRGPVDHQRDAVSAPAPVPAPPEGAASPTE